MFMSILANLFLFTLLTVMTVNLLSRFTTVLDKWRRPAMSSRIYKVIEDYRGADPELKAHDATQVLTNRIIDVVVEEKPHVR